MARGVIELKNPPRIIASAAVGGKKEGEGPCGEQFDMLDPTGLFGKETWEQAEAEMQGRALSLAMHKAKKRQEDLDLLIAGDLMNQCTSSSFGALSFGVPYLGIYGACSTSAEGLLLGSLLYDAGRASLLGVVVSSHFCSAERQFRYPLDYGGQRPPTAQWTVTGAGAFLLGHEGSGPSITAVLPGRIVDGGITDANNMGAAMAPAAYDTLKRYFDGSGSAPQDYDRIVTGDLGAEGYAILKDLFAHDGVTLGESYTDCGILIYDAARQDVHAGGSGCGCSATVLSAVLLPRRYKRMLYVATGALMSPMSVKQGMSIPGIAHLVCIESEG
ncbi:MAG: stage V sporulation protein AD [Ruminococcaceae bacterium]|nr:stage V sporulation protein AD [Oscillospiraceae bacterium]